MDVYVVVSIATTCDENNSYVTPDSSELILLAWTFVSASTLDIISSRSIYIRPTNTPITPWCTQIHGITWEHVRDAGSFRDAVAELEQSITETVGKDGFSFVSYDSFPLRVHIPREARDKAVDLPEYLRHPRVFELRSEFAKWKKDRKDGERSERGKDRGGTTAEMLAAIRASTEDDVPETAADALSPIDTCTAILVGLAKTPSLFTRPYDSAEDARMFKQEQSKILSLKNLPTDTTQSELESWFTQFGGRPVAFWAVKSDHHNHIGFAVFATHQQAAEALLMNGRGLGDRAIEVQPSSNSVLDKASAVLTPFPVSKNRPRPGDWTCPSCGFSNFQRRTACFRCAFPALSAATVLDNYRSGSQSSQGMARAPANQKYNVPFRAGDWKCTNDICQYHNFAKNICCLKCGANKPANIPHNNHMLNQYSSVNSTAAAIAAATASGQPLNFLSKLALPQMPIVSMQQQLQQLQNQNQNQNRYRQKPDYRGQDYNMLAEQVNGMSLHDV